MKLVVVFDGEAGYLVDPESGEPVDNVVDVAVGRKAGETFADVRLRIVGPGPRVDPPEAAHDVQFLDRGAFGVVDGQSANPPPSAVQEPLRTPAKRTLS